MANLTRDIADILTDERIESIDWLRALAIISSAPISYQNRIVMAVRGDRRDQLGSAIVSLIRSNLYAESLSEAGDIVGSGSIPIDIAEKLSSRGL